MPSILKTIAAYLFCTPFLGAGAYLLWTNHQIFNQFQEFKTWAPTSAEVLNYDFQSRSNSHYRGQSRVSRIVAEYTYTIDVQVYTGSRVDYTQHWNNFGQERKMEQLRQLREGRVEIYVHPTQPQESILDRRLPVEILTFNMGFIFFPCFLGWVALAGGSTQLTQFILGKNKLTKCFEWGMNALILGVFCYTPVRWLLTDPTSFTFWGL